MLDVVGLLNCLRFRTEGSLLDGAGGGKGRQSVVCNPLVGMNDDVKERRRFWG